MGKHTFGLCDCNILKFHCYTYTPCCAQHVMVSSFQALRSTFISIISYFISYNSYFLSHDMTGYHGQKYQTYKKLLKCSVVLGMYIGIFEKVKGILRFTSSYICTFPMKLRSKSFDYAHDDDVIKMKSPCLLSFFTRPSHQ